VIVRRLGAEEWREVRELRLRALADAPDAFWQTLADARARPESDWVARASVWAAAPTQAMLVAEPGDGGPLVGMAGVEPYDAEVEVDRGTGEPAGPVPRLVTDVWGVWADPALRGTGVGAALLEACVDWSRERGAAEVVLWCLDRKRDTLAWYGRRGFVPSGAEWSDAERPDDDRRYLELRRPLTDA